jgi:hypothetical protein
MDYLMPYIPLTLVAARSKASFCGRWLAGIAGSNSSGSRMSVYECCVFSGRGLCDGLIPRPERSPTMCAVSQCDRARHRKDPRPTRAVGSRERKIVLTSFFRKRRWV